MAKLLSEEAEQYVRKMVDMDDSSSDNATVDEQNQGIPEVFEFAEPQYCDEDDENDLDYSKSEKNYKEELPWADVLEEQFNNDFIMIIRCGAHTVQLVVHDITKTEQIKSLLIDIRKKVNKCRLAKYSFFF